MVLEQYITNNYLRALAILIVFYVIIKIPLFILKKIALKAAAKTKTQVDDLIVKKINGPLSMVVFLIGLQLLQR